MIEQISALLEESSPIGLLRSLNELQARGDKTKLMQRSATET